MSILEIAKDTAQFRNYNPNILEKIAPKDMQADND